MKSLRATLREGIMDVGIEDVKPYSPRTKNELKEIIEQLCRRKRKTVDLNVIDVSNITDMSWLFEEIPYHNVNISEWDVSKVKYMTGMFYGSKFNGDISKWNVSNVTDMTSMFAGSKFNGDISKWDVSKVTNMGYMFNESVFTGDISNWDVSGVRSMTRMFNKSKFNGDISKWDVSKVRSMTGIFGNCPMKKLPTWYKESK